MNGNHLGRLAVLGALTAVVLTAATALASHEARPPGWANTGTIAYHCGDSICLARPDGAGVRRLLPAASKKPWPQWDPAFSPDGRTIAFRGYFGTGDGEYSLYTAPASTCRARRITHDVAGDPAWSPDGRWIAFDTSGAGQLWKIHPNGSGLRWISGDGRRNLDSSPAWSRDGTRLAFVRQQGRHTALWLERPDGTRATMLLRDHGANDLSPAWSHDGSRIAFTRVTSAGASAIEMIDLATRKVRTVITALGAANPVWLPADAGIAYLSGFLPTTVHVVHPDGSDPHELAGFSTDQFHWTATPLPASRC